MKVVVAIDSLKGSLSSMEAGNAAAEGIKRVIDADIIVKPLADGGEGTMEALVSGMNGMLVLTEATGPLGEKVKCRYGVIPYSKTAIIEMAETAGITLVPMEKRNPMNTTTYGVGEVIKDAVRRGCRNFIIGIGGSATNDGGIGMLQALGYGFLDEDGKQIPMGAKGIEKFKPISSEGAMPELKKCTFRVACDVANTLCGTYGCSAVFGTQKSADEKMVKDMDKWLGAYAELTRMKYPNADAKMEGAGAAGGMGFGFSAFLNARLESGIEIVLDETGLEKDIKDADIVITGEGKLDFQTSMGKTPIGVAGLAKKYGKKVIAFAGCVTKEASQCNSQGIDAFFPILRSVTSLKEAMDKENAAENMRDAVEQVFRLICL